MTISELSPKLIHDAASESCRDPIGSAVTGSEVTLAFLDGSDSVVDAELCLYGDDFERLYELALENGRWFAKVTMPDTAAALWYCFRLTLADGEYWLCTGDGGRFARLQSSRGDGFRLTVYDAAFQTPAWFRRQIMYQIFPDRFARDGSDTAKRGIAAHLAAGRSPKYHESWDDTVDWQPNSASGFYFPLDYFGGTLRGIEENLDYIASFGVGVIYLNPIFESGSNHRYDTADYMNIDPVLGSVEDYERLCSRARERGIRIMLDGVFSHTGADSRYFNKFSRYPEKGAYNAGEASHYYKWYDFRHWPDEYRAWWNFPDLPEVDEENSDWQDFVVTGKDSVVRTWLRRGASGWRLDVADELPDDVLALIRSSAKEESPDAVVLGEVWEDCILKTSYGARRKYALGGALDSVMNYPLRTALIDFFTFRSDARSLSAFLLDQRLNYPKPLYYSLMNLTGSHDTDRIRTALATRLDAKTLPREKQAGFIVTDAQDARGASMQRLCAAVQFSLPGVPSVYYGEETGMSGMCDPFNRMPFREGLRPLTDWYRLLGSVRRDNDALSTGGAAFFAPDGDVLCVLRAVTGGHDVFGEETSDGVYLCAVNRSGYEKQFVADLWLDNTGLGSDALEALRALPLTRGECLLTGADIGITDGLARVTMPPESAAIFKLTGDKQ